jgi:cation diffusion facilitator family transporter
VDSQVGLKEWRRYCPRPYHSATVWRYTVWRKGQAIVMKQATHAHLPGQHGHSFGQDQKRPGEARTILVVIITLTMMVVEIAAGVVFGSMALLADGLHMGSHAVALGIAVFAYVYARRHAHDPRFNFGTGKVNALGGFTGALLLILFALAMAFESLDRFVYPVPIAFNQAIFVAVIGLLVNGMSVVILGHEHHHHDHDHDHHHDHHHGHDDHNLRSAYLHVLADALTSIFAIVALLSGKYFGWVWLDPFMGIVGAVLVAIWARGLLQRTARELLDMQPAETLRAAVRETLENDGATVTDFHLWAIGPGIHAAAISLAAREPREARHYHALLAKHAAVAHLTIEVHRIPESGTDDVLSCQ